MQPQSIGTRGSRLKFDVEGEDLSTEFATVDIWAAGVYVATVGVNEFGQFNLDLDTFEGDKGVPALVEGDLVEVFDGATGKIMFAGTLQIDN